jgi:hypothetical protein
MLRKYLILFLILAGIASCAKKQATEEAASDTASKRQEGKYLAYEHSITVDVSEENLSEAFRTTLDACLADKENNCTILDSRISKGTYPFANIRLRIKPAGVKGIIAVASGKGKVVQQSTHVEDLAKPVLDNIQRLKMLESHRDNLMELQEKAKNDVDSLIKVSSELSRVLSELEQARGEEGFLSQRINMEVVNIQYQVQLSRSFWKPISNSLARFSNNLSEGISGTIVAVAYLLPGAVLFIVVFVFVRFLLKRRQRRANRAQQRLAPNERTHG